MSILRRRRGRSAQAEGPAPPARPAEPRLEERLREIAAGVAAPEEALEPALRAILESSGAQAGALCLFDPRHALMRLAAEEGLSEEGCARLRSVRRADPASWDMPLHGLLNRRAYLIESAARNRYVPALVESAASVRSVACVPVYGGAAPLGSVILISLAPRTFAERDIHALERPLRELACMIEAARRRGGTPEDPAPPRPFAPSPVADVIGLLAERDRLRDEVTTRQAEYASLAAELAALTGENDHLRLALGQGADERGRLAAELERARRDAERGSTVAASLAAAERERARLASALEAAAQARAEETRATIALEQGRAAAERAAQSALADLEATRRALGASAASASARVTELSVEVERLQARLIEAEATVAQERGRAEEREAEQQRIATALHDATAREQALRAELRSATARALSDEQGELRQALEAVRAAEEARVAARAEADTARTALESSQAIVEALEDEAGHTHVEVEQLLAAERTSRTAQERMEEELAGVRVRERDASARVAEVEREIGILRKERSRLTGEGREHEASLAARTARLESLAAERDQLQDALTRAAQEHERVLADATAATSARTRLEEAFARETAERGRLAGALTTLQASLAELERTQARHEAETASRTAEIERLRSECDRLAGERDRLLTEQGARPVEEPPTAPTEPVRVVTMASAASRSRARESVTGARRIVVLDTDGSWERAALEGHEIAVEVPGLDVAERLGSRTPSRLIANLAAPGALEAIIALRAAGSSLRVWGCIAAPGANRALMLGMIEPANRPLDPDAVLAVLAHYAARGTRIVTAGADVDALMSLRQALARQGMSVSMAWDAKQAADLMGVVRPEVAVVDLALPRRDGYAIVAGLAGGDPPPSAILLPGEGDAAAAFAAALADPVRAGLVVPLDRVLNGVAVRTEAAPAERRQKVRAIGRK